MDIAQVSTQFFTAAAPAVGISAGIVGFLLVISGCMLRWKRLCATIRRVVLRRSQYDYRQIFGDYLERFNAISDRRELYPAILSAACRIVGATGASLVVRDVKERFQMKASQGLKPFSFDVEAVKPFLNWLEKYRDVVARCDLVESRDFAGVKGDGLCYFVQFNAEACVPLFVSDRLYGVINLGARGGNGYDEETRDLLKLMAVQFATAIHNANLYQAMVRQNLSLQEASRFKSQLISNLSHELRTPLTSIIGLSELMSEGGDGDMSEEQKKHLGMIRHSGVRLLDTVTSILDISKLEANKLDLNIQKVNIRRIVSEIAGKLKLNEQTTMELKVDEDTPGVYGDEKRLKQVLGHLLGNAAKFTRKGKISVEAEKCGEMLKLKVKDTGIGIAKDKQKSIFESFGQADGSVTREYEGLGLGLAISKKLVELHGGRLWLQSQEGRGSEFYLTLPLKPVGVFNRPVRPVSQ